MSNPSRQKRAQPSEEVLRKIQVARSERQKIERMRPGKAKIAARKAWVVKHSGIMEDYRLYDAYLNSPHDFPTYSGGKRLERAS